MMLIYKIYIDTIESSMPRKKKSKLIPIQSNSVKLVKRTKNKEKNREELKNSNQDDEFKSSNRNALYIQFQNACLYGDFTTVNRYLNDRILKQIIDIFLPH